jgi:PGF-CTERM protein
MPDDETTTESGGQPGFGVAVALVALLAAALLATRRDE